MFDANMRHLPKGEEFFAEVWACHESLQSRGLKSNDVILCEMLEDDVANPLIKFLFNNEWTYLRADDCFEDNWFVYAGLRDLTQFLDHRPEVKDKARKVLESLNKKSLNKESLNKESLNTENYKLWRVDPEDCRCIDCILGESKPIDECSQSDLRRIWYKELENASGYEVRYDVVKKSFGLTTK